MKMLTNRFCSLLGVFRYHDYHIQTIRTWKFLSKLLENFWHHSPIFHHIFPMIYAQHNNDIHIFCKNFISSHIISRHNRIDSWAVDVAKFIQFEISELYLRLGELQRQINFNTNGRYSSHMPNKLQIHQASSVRPKFTVNSRY